MRKLGFAMLSMLLAAFVLAACGGKTYKPVAINEATDKCEICSMQVRDEAFAVQLTTKEGKTYFFDDIGCMNKWKTKNASVEIGAAFVRDNFDLAWIPYDQAYYAYDASFRTPMAYGIYSFKDEKSARSFIDEQKKGKLMTAADLSGHTWAQNMEQMKGMMDMDDHDKNAHTESDQTRMEMPDGKDTE